MSIKTAKISYFSFSFKLNEKKVPLKNMVWRGGATKKFSLEEGGIFQIKGA